jgi:hypothetical protein
MTGPAVMAWNPYELKIYIAGQGSGISDWTKEQYVEGSSPDPNIRPAGISSDDWQSTRWASSNKPTIEKINRLLLLTSDLSSGATTGIYAQPFTQVYSITKQGTNLSASIVSSSFNEITCFGFSPNISAVGGSLKDSNNAAVYWRKGISSASDELKANWSLIDLGTKGSVTAMKYVGYAWYIATWDPDANKDPISGDFEGASTVFFASINFSAVSPVDAWNTGQNIFYKITTIDSSVLLDGVCQPGFEPDPNEPTVCVKKCPNGYTPFGTLCVQACPGPYMETGVPNECKPDSFAPRTSAPIGAGSPLYTQAPKESPTQIMRSEQSVNWTSFASITFLVFLAVFVILGFAVRGRKR